ncbi:MAG TPA: cation:proton antiporter [Longimicrobiaceae bacterium]|nr:cation:proton antiporter [Longimicrobiaceae bacterium]
MTLPITDPVLIFALAMVLFVAMPPLFERARVPGIIGLIVAGAVVGPHGLNLLARGSTIVLLGTVGLLYLMFMVGLELNMPDFRRYRHRSLVFGSISFLVPQAVGTAFGQLFGYPLGASLLMGGVFASHTVLAYPLASRLGIVQNLAVTTTLGGTILSETLALMVLAVVVAALGGSVSVHFWVVLVLSLTLYALVILWGVPKVARWFFRNAGGDTALDFLFVMAVVFSVAWASHLAYAEPIIGALLAGLAFNRLVPETSSLMSRIHFAGNALFIPFFLLSVGMLVDVRSLSTWQSWLFAGGLTLGVIVSKWLAAWGTERIFGYTREEGWVIFGLSVPHASGTLAIVLVGFQMGIFHEHAVNGAVVAILVTSLVGPWFVERFGRKVALAEEQKPYTPADAPRRVLVPIANPATEEALLDLAIVLRGPDSTEPLYPLMVVRGLGEDPEAEVAEAERMLSHAVIYATAAEVPVAPLTRVDPNVADGVARGIAETRSTTVVVGWDGGRTPVGGIFGSVLDDIVQQTRQMVVVAKLGPPLNTTGRVLVVLPPLAHRHPGFFEAAATTKRLAAQLGASLHGIVIGADAERYAELFRPIKPNVDSTFQRVEGWSALPGALLGQVRLDDLVVVLSARPGTLPWSFRLERLPGRLARLLPGSFLMLYPPEVDTHRREPSRAVELPLGLRPDRIVRDLPPAPFEDTLQTILDHGFVAPPRRREEIARVLAAGERDFSSEVRPGVVVPHARVAGITERKVLLGVSPEGVDFPRARGPAHLIFVLLSPIERPEEHLRALAEIAAVVSSEEQIATLLADQPAAEVAE